MAGPRSCEALRLSRQNRRAPDPEWEGGESGNETRQIVAGACRSEETDSPVALLSLELGRVHAATGRGHLRGDNARKHTAQGGPPAWSLSSRLQRTVRLGFSVIGGYGLYFNSCPGSWNFLLKFLSSSLKTFVSFSGKWNP